MVVVVTFLGGLLRFAVKRGTIHVHFRAKGCSADTTRRKK
jgi:hypothetical protein